MAEEKIEKIKKIIPHSFVVFEIASTKPAEEVQLKSTEWAIITQIDGKKTIKEIQNSLGFTDDEIFNTFYELYEKGLIKINQIQTPDQIYASEAFFAELEETLIRIVGPVASFLIEDVLWELNETKTNFMKEKVPLLTESISQEINDDNKRVQFQQAMLEIIKKI